MKENNFSNYLLHFLHGINVPCISAAGDIILCVIRGILARLNATYYCQRLKTGGD